MFFPPLIFLLMIAFFILILFLFAFLQVGLIGVAFAKLGLPPESLFGFLFLTLLGSFINIPITELESKQLVQAKNVPFFGLRLRVPPVYRINKTVLAINVGGALVPLMISIYLWSWLDSFFIPALVTAIVTLVVNRLSRPVPGIGIAVPALLPPLVTVIATYLLVAADMRAPVAYIAGTLGTLIGADLLRLKEIGQLGAPVASIGGAGTFDGVFLCGIIAVLLS